MTRAHFYHGPYDGLVLDGEGLRRYCHSCEAGKRGRVRQFYLLPPLSAWEAVVSGWVDEETELTGCHIYELVAEGESAELRYRSRGGVREAKRLSA